LVGECVVTDLRKALKDYLELRRSLGFELRWYDKWLGDFLDFVKEAGSPVLTTSLAVAWATRSKKARRSWQARQLAFVRGFARYVHTLDPRTEVPPPDLLPQADGKRPPYLYSEGNVRALMAAAQELKPSMRAFTYTTLTGLLAVTGMRVGETIALDRNDVALKEAVLTVRNGKFRKSREVAIHPTTCAALAAYAAERDRTLPGRGVLPFFVSLRNRRLLYQDVRVTFARLVDRVGLAGQSPRRPRIHDLRHAFAFWTLRDWQDAGLDLEQRLPLLSTHLGHISPSTTYWYLNASLDLLGVAAKQLEQHLGDLP
jgi:integrase/recombinase XerD